MTVTRVWGGQIPNSKVCWRRLLSLVAGRPCPQPISFSFSAVAYDWMLFLVPLASSRLTSSLDPRLPVRPPLSVLHLVAPCIHAVPLTQTVLSSIPVSHRSQSISGSITLSCTTPALGSAPVAAVALVRFIFLLLRSHISSAPRPFFSFPSLSRAVWSCPDSPALFP